MEGFSVYAVAMKDTKIEIFVYHNYGSLLEDYGIFNYRGFIPLNYEIPYANFKEINSGPLFNEFDLLGDYAKHIKGGIETNLDKLRDMGVESTAKMRIPHFWVLLNKDHEDNKHNYVYAYGIRWTRKRYKINKHNYVYLIFDG